MGEHLKILLIDDDEDEMVVIKKMLRKALGDGFTLDWTAVWGEGLETLNSGAHDVCLVDYNLGSGNGIDLMRWATVNGSKTPFIMLTGQDSRDIDLAATEAGASDYLSKNEISAPLLERAIRFAIARQTLLSAQIHTNEALKTVNQKLSEVNKLAHEFVDNLSHEFRTPLTVIKEYASIIKDGLVGPVNDEQTEYLDIVVDRVDDLSIMVNDMLDISRLEAGLLGISREGCSIEDITDRIAPILERKAATQSVFLNFDIQDGKARVYCDPEKVRRVIINLAINAIKFSEAQSQVTLSTRTGANGDEIIFAVSDSGAGITPDNLRHIFQRFEQVGDNARAKTKGFGLGLNIAKELVHMNLGEITVESTLGSGSTFSFTVPLFDPPRVLARYIGQIHRMRGDTSRLALITANTPVQLDAISSEEIGQFLQCQVRHSDLLFCKGPGAWLLVAAANQEDLDPLLQRIERSWVEANRNRPVRPLPRVEMKVLGTWKIEEQSGELLQRFGEAYESKPAGRTVDCDDGGLRVAVN